MLLPLEIYSYSCYHIKVRMKVSDNPGTNDIILRNIYSIKGNIKINPTRAIFNQTRVECHI